MQDFTFHEEIKDLFLNAKQNLKFQHIIYILFEKNKYLHSNAISDAKKGILTFCKL